MESTRTLPGLRKKRKKVLKKRLSVKRINGVSLYIFCVLLSNFSKVKRIISRTWNLQYTFDWKRYHIMKFMKGFAKFLCPKQEYPQVWVPVLLYHTTFYKFFGDIIGNNNYKLCSHYSHFCWKCAFVGLQTCLQLCVSKSSLYGQTHCNSVKVLKNS